VLEEWREYASILPKFAREALLDVTLDKAPDKLIEAGLRAAAGAVTSTVLGATKGLLITVAVAVGIRMYRRENTPFSFLNRIDKTVNHSIGSLYVPQWRALAGDI
jgi:hypothetical protein